MIKDDGYNPENPVNTGALVYCHGEWMLTNYVDILWGGKGFMYEDKNDEILRLIGQIAADMVKRSDVDDIVKKAVAEEHDRIVALYEGKMKDRAADYEAKIAAIKRGRSQKNTRGCSKSN